MAEAKQGDTVKIHYTGQLSDGTKFDSSEGRDPLEFKIGEGRIIPGFENAVIGMNVGDSKTETFPAAEAYGQRRDEMVVQIQKSQIPDDMQLEVGQQIQVGGEEGQTMVARVSALSEEGATLDLNHPLAGKDLTFEIRLVEID